MTPDHAQDLYRLPKHVTPNRYDLTLTPDLDAARFDGQVIIAIDVHETATELILNAVELQIHEAMVEQGSTRRRCEIEMEDTHERVRIRPESALARGHWLLTMRFSGLLNDKLRGFYRSTYRDDQGRPHTLAATQFEATDARRAFPCWDEPAFKAVFRTALVVPPDLAAVSNTPVESEALDAGKKVVRFKETIRMSTYLVAFVVGRLEASEPVMVGATPIRIWSVPGKRHLHAFGLDSAAASLGLFERYYGIPYPGEKLDLLAIPDFASGAMENLGAITFRETALLIDTARASHAELERVADVVAHENAHMWFGDLVTMSWWNGLWLNEAFATFMEMLAVDAWKPEWKRWTTFGASRAAAMSVDALHSTRPIEYPVVAPHDADAMFDVLTYEKGASVLRMLEQHLGPDVFRDGVRRYLRRHAYDNADTVDLWTALGEASQQEVPALMNEWIFSPGYPIVSAALDRGAGNSVVKLTQQRFTYLPNPPVSPRWRIPVQIRVRHEGRESLRQVLLTDAEVRVPLPAGSEEVVINAGGPGFYRVRYADDLQGRISTALAAGRLSGIERFNIVNDTWATAVAGLAPLEGYLDLTAEFRGERDRNVWTALLGSFDVLNRLITSAQRPRFEALVRDRLRPAVRALGWDPDPGEDELTRQLRGDLVRALGILGNDLEVQQAARRRAEHPDGLDANVSAAVIGILAHAGDAAQFEEYVGRYRTASTPQEERRYLYSLTAFRVPELLMRALQMAVGGEIRTQDAPFIVRLALGNVYGRDLAWDFVKQQWDHMVRQYPKNGLRRLLEGISSLATPSLEEDVRRFVADRKIDLGGKTLEQYLEQLRIAVSFRERMLPTLDRYLARFA